eukprot:2291809-Rhodomonas_salina.2
MVIPGESSPMAIDHGDIHLQQVNSIGSTASERDRSERIQEGMKLLDQRLALLKLRQIQMEDDGNCQFRSFSSELFGTQVSDQLRSFFSLFSRQDQCCPTRSTPTPILTCAYGVVRRSTTRPCGTWQ